MNRGIHIISYMHRSKGQSQFHDVKLLSHLNLTYDMRYWKKMGKKDLKFGSTDHDLPYSKACQRLYSKHLLSQQMEKGATSYERKET